MTLIDRKPACVVTVLAAMTLVSCATTVAPYTADQNAMSMDARKAHHVVAEALPHRGLVTYTQCRVEGDGQLSTEGGHRYFVMSGVRIRSGDIMITGTEGQSVVLPFKDMKIAAGTYRIVLQYAKNGGCFGLIKLAVATPTLVDLADALLVLKREAAVESEPHFEEAVRAYHAAAVKPPLPEAARRFKVQALDAVRHNQLEDAADLYEQATEVAPWWPVAHFDRALLLGKTKDYDSAIMEMKRYLELVPDAPNARAAQDQIYIWQRKAEANTP